MVTASRILGDEVGSTAPAFLAVLAVHVLAGLTAVITGAIATLTRKGSPRHVRAGRWYYRALAAVFATATALAVMRWAQDWYLLVLGAVAFAAATAGYLHRRRHRAGIPGTSPGWASPTPPCSPRSTSTTGRTCRCGTGCPRWRSGCCPRPSPLPSSPVPSCGRGQVRRETANPVAELGYSRVEAGGIAAGTGSGTDQSTAAWPPSSSRATSHTVITRSPSSSTSLMGRGRSRGSGGRYHGRRRSRRDRSVRRLVPAETAPGRRWPGADAAARCERAELAVHTNSTRGTATAGAATRCPSPGSRP